MQSRFFTRRWGNRSVFRCQLPASTGLVAAVAVLAVAASVGLVQAQAVINGRRCRNATIVPDSHRFCH